MVVLGWLCSIGLSCFQFGPVFIRGLNLEFVKGFEGPSCLVHVRLFGFDVLLDDPWKEKRKLKAGEAKDAPQVCHVILAYIGLSPFPVIVTT